MMLLVSIMATGGNWGLIVGKLALALLLAAVLIGLFYTLFNYVAPRLMLVPTWQKNRDLPVLLAVIMATGSARATHAIGLSPALGAFSAGVLLAVSPFATQIRADTRPLTTVMVTLFFASIGMFGDPVWVLAGERSVSLGRSPAARSACPMWPNNRGVAMKRFQRILADVDFVSGDELVLDELVAPSQ